jgi:hypothetical protein
MACSFMPRWGWPGIVVAVCPGEERVSGVRIMGYDALDTAGFPDVGGLRTWAGEDLAVAPDPKIGKVYVRGQKWMGESYDAMFDPGHATRIWRNVQEMKTHRAESYLAGDEKETECHVRAFRVGCRFVEASRVIGCSREG